MKQALKFSLFSLIVFSALIGSAQGEAKTKVIVEEGKVICFDLPKDLVNVKDTATGIFLEQIDGDSGRAKIRKQQARCYIPQKYRNRIAKRLHTGTYIYVIKKIRRLKRTKWDIVSTGTVVKAGYEYSGARILHAQTESAVIPAVPAAGVSAVDKEETHIGEGGGASAESTSTSEVPSILPAEPEVPSEEEEPSEFFWVNPTSNTYTIGGLEIQPGTDAKGNDGSNDEPWATVAYALSRAEVTEGSTINLVGTTFTETAISVTSKNSITILGQGADSTVFDGGGSDRAFKLYFSSNIMFRDTGFTNCSAPGTINPAGDGGAIVITSSDVNFRDCAFTNNSAANAGGAMGIKGTSTVTITDCSFTGNTSTNIGGAIHAAGPINLTISGTTTLTLPVNVVHFSSNTSSSTGGAIACSNISSLSLNQLVFTKNGAATGGAVFLQSMGRRGTVQKCIFGQNSASSNVQGGSAIYMEGASSTIRNCFFDRNTCTNPNGEGAVDCDLNSNAVIQNCTFSENTSASGFGQGISVSNNSNPAITNCILRHSASNVLHTRDSASKPQITNCNFFGTPNEARNVAANGTIANFAGWGWDGTGCINTDPQLKGKITGDYRITNASSGAVDTGADISDITDDIMGNPRTPGSYDMGCYESSAGDPAVTGRIYNSVTGETISSPVVAIYKKNSTTALAVTTNNPYTFNVASGSYYIAVSKAGFGFPSQVTGTVVPGDHGDIFTAGADAVSIDIPVDPAGWLYVEKKVNKKTVEAGDIVTYHITIQNKHWFEAVSNVELIDEITNGFKYAADSAVNYSPANVTGHKIYFDLGTIPANTTRTLSYQVRAGTGIPPGRYKAGVHTVNTKTNSRNSNISSAEIEVIDDPLFSRGTIIGKVFWDINGNAVQDAGEPGISGIRIYTEYGVSAETDETGKYHIKDVPAGNHLLKADDTSFPKTAEFTAENPYYVKITEGLPAKVNFGINFKGAEKETKDTKNRFFITALGEGTLRNLTSSGNIEMVNKDDRYDNGINVDGRIALFLKGKILGKYLITAGLDTERRPGGRYDTRRVFTNLDPDKYYPVYGDASKADYSGTDTQDIVYLLVKWDNSFAKWGSFHTGLPLYNRTLSGGIINYESVRKTKFGDSKTKITGFGAFSRQSPAHDEFAGTGGSLYYLRHSDIIEGSEKVRVELRDRVGKITMNSITLNEEKDYEIDYDTGRILLKKPLNGIQQSYTESIISNDILMGERAYLVIDYEYYNKRLSNEALGINVSRWLGNHIRIGGTYIEEQKPGDNYKLAGGEAGMRLNKDTEVNVSYSRTEETQLDSSMSYDGGLSFTAQDENYSLGKSGGSLTVDGKTRIFGNTDIYAAYMRQDPFYSVTNSISSQGSRKYIANIISRLTGALTLGLKHITRQYFDGSIAGDIYGASETHTTTAIADYRRGRWDIRGEYQHQETGNPVTDYVYFGTLPLLQNDFIAIRAGYQLFSWFHPYIRGQFTASGAENNQKTAGADINIGSSTQLNIAETTGTLGNSTLLGITTRVTEGTDIYSNIETGNNLMLGKYTKTSYGHSSQLSPDSRAYIEEDYSSYRENVVRGSLLGYNRKLTGALSAGITYERSNVKNNTTAIDRDAGSISLSYLDPGRLKAYSKLEIRNDKGTNTTRQWVTENDFLWEATDDLTLSGRGNFGLSQNPYTDTDKAEFYELGAGFSLRPVAWDKLNIIGKYSYLSDLPPDSKRDFPEDTKSRRGIYSIEGIFDLCRFVQLAGKFSYRDMREKTGQRSWTQSNTYLYICRMNFHITHKWDIAAEYRILANRQIEDAKKGWLLEIDRDIGRYLRIGTGYNFTDYNDDLRNEDNWDAKGWFVKLAGKY